MTTRIMVVDDSVVARRMIGDILRSEPDFEVVGTAANGRIALAKIPLVEPEVITLDVDMPEMNGMEMLASLREHHPDIRVLMVSSLTKKGAKTTVDALFLGASDYVTKTSNVDSAEQALELMRSQLVPKIRALMAAPVPEGPVFKPKVPDKVVVAAKPTGTRVEPRIIAIGSSTGGPNALVKVLTVLPRDFPIPIVIVQHMPEDFTSHLANRLDDQCRISVREACDGMPLQRGQALIAPGNHHMEVVSEGTNKFVSLNDGPLVNSCRPSVDVLFRSVAGIYGPAVLAVVLTGMGQDGFEGSQTLVAGRSRVIAQDKESSVVWGMPGFVAQSKLADKVLPVDKIGAEITVSVRRRQR